MTVYSRRTNKAASLSRICLMGHPSLIKGKNLLLVTGEQVNYPTKVRPFLCALKITSLCFELLMHKQLVANHSPELNKWLKTMSRIHP